MIMHDLEKQLLDIGAIDAAIESLTIGDWFDRIEITFITRNNNITTCKFINCFEVSLNHDKTYSKGKTEGGYLDYKYFIQDISVSEEDYIIFQISAWPLEGKIMCKKIEII
ncbi:hypothetical protein FACS189418_0960 [Clostridia bacterium]|nr:hypothetical protein FACS189418_0960 [Clostridia bacterium]